MGLRDLSEAIILQSAEDLLGAPHEEEVMSFFSGEGFRLCAEMAKMSHEDKLKFLNMLTDCISECRNKANRSSGMSVQNKRVFRGSGYSQRSRKSLTASAV